MCLAKLHNFFVSSNTTNYIHVYFLSVVHNDNLFLPIPQISSARDKADEFFGLPVETKSCYARQGDDNHGWVALEREK